MPLLGPNAADVEKIHTEVTQIVNQRLSLSVLTITVFGAMIAWMTPSPDPPSQSNVGIFIYVGALLLVIILFLLFLLTYYLSYMLRTFSTYLEVTGASNWELDWAGYRTKFGYMGYTKPQTFIFLALGGVSAAYPYFLIRAFDLNFEPTWGLWLCGGLGLLYLFFVYGIGIKGWFQKEGEIFRKWKELKES